MHVNTVASQNGLTLSVWSSIGFFQVWRVRRPRQTSVELAPTHAANELGAKALITINIGRPAFGNVVSDERDSCLDEVSRHVAKMLVAITVMRAARPSRYKIVNMRTVSP